MVSRLRCCAYDDRCDPLRIQKPELFDQDGYFFDKSGRLRYTGQLGTGSRSPEMCGKRPTLDGRSPYQTLLCSCRPARPSCYRGDRSVGRRNATNSAG